MDQPLPHTPQDTRIALYGALQEQYRKMLTVAIENDWDRLAAMELEATALMRRIKAAPPVRPEEVPQVTALIEATLALGEEIETHARPCLESTRKLLRHSVQDRNVRRAYGAV